MTIKRYAVINVDGSPLGFYGDDTHDASTMPYKVVAVSEDNWITYNSNQNGYKFNTLGNIETITPADIEVFNQAKAYKLASLLASRDATIYSSFTSDAVGSARTYSYDKEAYDNFGRETALMGVDTTITSVYWVTDSGFTLHTREQFIQVIRDGAKHELDAKMKYYTLEAQVANVTLNGHTLQQALTQLEQIVW